MAKPRIWSKELLPDLRQALVELAQPDAAQDSPDDTLERLTGRFPSVGRGLVELMARDPSKRVSEQAALLLYYAARLAPARLRSRVVGAMTIDLLEAMRDPTVTDERKYSIGPMLAEVGQELPDDDYASCFQDFGGTVERLTRESMTTLLDSPEQVEALIAFRPLVGEVDPDAGDAEAARAIEEALDTAVETLLHNAPVGAVLACTLAATARERGVATEAALAALDLVANTATHRAAWYLAELGRWPAGGEIGERARALATRAGMPAGKAQRTPPFSHGLVSAIDGEGSRDVIAFFRSSDGTLDALVLLMNERLGLLDVFLSFGDGVELEQQARERYGSWAPCDVAFARELLADAFATHEKTGRPVPGRLLLARPLLREEPVPVHARACELGAYAFETCAPEPGLAAGSQALAEHEVYGDLGSTSDAAYAFVRSRRRRRVEDFLREVVLPERGVLMARFGAALEIEARAGRARTPANRLAARTFVALESSVVPFLEVPYVRAVARRALQAVERNVRKGFRSQAEASAALAAGGAGPHAAG
jgi:hypothetical protein